MEQDARRDGWNPSIAIRRWTVCSTAFLAMVITSGVLTGCSELAVYDAYIPDGPANKDGTFYFESADALVSLNFDPKTRFASVGLLGVPAIPGVINGKKQKTLNLLISVQLRKPSDFSFNLHPCLQTLEKLELCPSDVTIKATAMTDAPGAYDYGRIGQFFGQWTPLIIGLPSSYSEDRLRAADIYRYYRYENDPPWSLMQVYLNYRYVCAAECPTDFSLSLDGLVIAEKHIQTSGQRMFHRKRVKDYRPMEAVQ